jgi:hypothetical protein
MADDTDCPKCGGELRILQQGTRRQGPVGATGGEIPERNVETIAQCQNLDCKRYWRRDWGDQGEWSEKP